MEHTSWVDGALLASADHEQKLVKKIEEGTIFMLSGGCSPDQNTSCDGASANRRGAWEGGGAGAVVPTWVWPGGPERPEPRTTCPGQSEYSYS